MRRVLGGLAVLFVTLLAASSSPAYATTAVLRFSPPTKYVDIVASSYAETNVDANLAVGEATGNQRRAQGIKVPATKTVGRVNLWLRATGAPADNLTVKIQTNSGGLPSGTQVTNGASDPVAGGTVGSSYGWVAFDFSMPPSLTAATQYHLVLERSTAVDPANYYVWGADQPGPTYADGVGSIYGGSSWLATSPATDHAFQVRPTFSVDAYVSNVDTTEPCLPPDFTQACGLGGYQINVNFDPNAIKFVSVGNGSFLTSTGRTIWSCFNPLGHDPAAGVVTYGCTTTGTPPGGPTPFGPEGSGALATITFVPLVLGTSSLQFDVQGAGRTLLSETTGTEVSFTGESGSVTMGDYGVPLPAADSDGDGCTDIEEAGDDPALGGDRNPNFYWDFYDVPVPARADPTANGPRSQTVAMTDVLAVLFYVGTANNGNPNPNNVDYDSLKDGDWNGDTVLNSDDEVGRRYDRSASFPYSGAPNGAIAMSDVLAALNQVSHSCVGPP
jgi:hypothetical protein